MSEPTVNIAVGGGTPGANSNDYTLFDSTSALGRAKILPQTGLKRIQFTVNNSQAGTLKAYFSADGGTNWYLHDQQSVAAAAAPAMSGPFDYDITPYLDWKLVWTNGGSAQSTWVPLLTGLTDRVPGA